MKKEFYIGARFDVIIYKYGSQDYSIRAYSKLTKECVAHDEHLPKATIYECCCIWISKRHTYQGFDSLECHLTVATHK